MAFQKVRVNSDWSDPANIWQDIKQATGMSVPSDSECEFPSCEFHIDFVLWEGKADPGDYAKVRISNRDGITFRPNFDSPPVRGTAFIIGVDVFHTWYPS